MKKRSEVEEKFKWDLSKFCKSDEEFYEKLEKFSKNLEKLKSYEGKLSDDDVLLEYLDFSFEKLHKESAFMNYAFYRQCEDTSARQPDEMLEKMSIVLAKFNEVSAAVESEIDHFPLKKMQRLQKDEKFKKYRRFFEQEIRHKKHTLSKKEEVLLSKMSEFTGGFSDNFDKFSDADLKFGEIMDGKGKTHDLNHSNFSVYVESEDRVLRKNAYERMNGKYGEFINFLGNNYICDVKEDCIFAKMRGYKSALSRAIYSEEASEKVYGMLIKKVRENVGILQRYFEVKRKMLGLKDFAIYDTFAPVVSQKSGKKFSYDEAIDLVKAAVAPLGKEYVSLIQRAKDERWIDVMPNENKRSGAFSSSTFGVTPVVLTNFEGNLESVFTLAHELGHAIHSHLSCTNQPVQTADYVIFVAEVASTTNEMLLLRYLLDRASGREEKIMLIDHFLKEVRSCIFRQTMFAEFEQFAHEEYEKENPLSVELLCEKYEELNNFYHGKKVKQIKEMRYEWARIPHFFDSFYVYKYATGLISAIKISTQILEDKNFYKKYLKFLSSGSSTDPISLLRIADCDLEDPKTFDDAFRTCEEYIQMWEQLM